MTTYLRIRNWETYQNADIFKKSKGRPPWVKLYVAMLDDYKFGLLPHVTQLLFIKLLLVTAKAGEAIVNDSEWLVKQTGIGSEDIVNSVALLVKGAWLTETKTLRRSRKIRDTFAKDSPLEQNREEEIKDPPVAPPTAEPDFDVNGAATFTTPERPRPIDPIGRLLFEIRDADKNTPQVIRSFATQLPAAAFETTRERLIEGRPTIRSDAAYAVDLLKTMVTEHRYAS